MGRRIEDRPVLLVTTVREDEEGAALRRMTGELAELPHLARIDLGALSLPATAALVRALARAGSHRVRLAEITDKVWTLSEGNPFVIVETVRTLRDGRLPDAAGVELPERVRAMIAARLERLSPRARALAHVASAFTRDFEFSVLQRAGGLGRRDTAEALEELVRRRILDAVGERFDFTHVRMRDAVYAALLPARRQVLHAAIGEAVEAVYAGRLDEWYDRLAYHFARADEAAKTVTYLVGLADQAARRHALDDAVRVFHDALGHAERMADGARARLDVVFRLAHVLMLLGRPAEVRDLLGAHDALVAGLREPAFSALYHFWVACTYCHLGDPEPLVRHARRALEEAARIGDEATMGKASYTLAYHGHMVGTPVEGVAHGRHAAALLERTEERWWLGQALWALARNLIQLGELVAALDALARMRAIGDALGDSRLQAYAAGTTGRAYALMGRPEEAIDACQCAVALAADPVARAHATGWLGVSHWDNDQPAEAIRLLEDSVRQLRHLTGTGGYRRWDGWFAAVLSESYLLVGETDRARDRAADALAAATAGGFPVARGYAERAGGKVARATGKLDEAETGLRRALHTFVAIGAPGEEARTRMALAEVLAARGDGGAATAELAAARETFTGMRVPALVERTERLAATLGLSID